MNKREQELISKGFEFHSYEYEEGAKRLARKQGREVALVRVRTGTKGLKMYAVYVA